MISLQLIVEPFHMLDDSIFFLDRPLQGIIHLINIKHLLFELLHLHVDFSVVLSSILTYSLILFLHLSELFLNPFNIHLSILFLQLHVFDLPDKHLHLPIALLLVMLCVLYHLSLPRKLIFESQVDPLKLSELLLKRCLLGQSQVEPLILPTKGSLELGFLRLQDA